MRGIDLSSQAAIVLGIFVGIISTSIQSLGLTLQRKSHLLEEHRPSPRPPYRRRRWQIGMGLFITSNILGSSVQIGQALIVTCLLVLARLSVGPKRAGNNSRWRMIRGAAYGSVSGILSADSLLLAKSAVELLIRTVTTGDNQFTNWASWIIVISLVVIALTQLFYLHKGLKLCSTSVLYPLVFCIYNIFAISNGLIYYNQAGKLSALSSALITLGVLILLSGVLALSWRLEQNNQPFNQDASETPDVVLDSEDSEQAHLLAESSESPVASPNWFKYINIKPVTFAERRNSPTATSRYGTISRRRTLTETREILAELESDASPPPSDYNGAGGLTDSDGRTSVLPEFGNSRHP
ncbi:hypothetical protein Dda_3500 [Drechslerella dactyloides]|uniref:DUF803 domain-containing protein n=1 Tax=Drechslerella dactyloides TaxID=74499 RepID=A0AAD6IZK2_DREDA|nr:hypothetical protein Dda_3500 [Drechslerella dactyloides]